jgi:hypothetical protein
MPSSPKRRRVVLGHLLSKISSGTSSEAAPVTPEKKPCANLLPEVTKQAVEEFFHRDDVSRAAPGRRDFVRVRSPNDEIVLLQLRHLLMSLKEAHHFYLQEENERLCGLTKFSEWRPIEVKLASDMPLNACCCRTHEDFIR